MDENLPNTKEQMIARADMAIKKVAGEFSDNLNQRVSEMDAAILKNDKDQVVKMAYELETEAATFGWPRVTRLCKWLRKVFDSDYDSKPDPELVLKTLNILKTMVNDTANKDEERDQLLFKELYPDLKKVISDI